ncbi:MAG: hypothetical protein PHW63_09110 [Alphaproteobacteria bacterium]|nr:hypothetical protein [Alphaproteobacteria bacterium]
MPDILKRFGTYKNTLTQHGTIALIGAGMVAWGFAIGSLIDPQRNTIISCSHFTGEAGALSLLFSYGKGLYALHKEKCEGSAISPEKSHRERKALVKESILDSILGGAAALCFMSIILTGVKTYKIMKANSHIFAVHNTLESAKLADTVCLTPASREITVAGQKSTIIVDKKVLQETLFPENTMGHSGTIAIRYTYDDLSGNNRKTTQTHHLPITRQGPYDPKAAKEGRGCIPLDKFNFEN